MRMKKSWCVAYAVKPSVAMVAVAKATVVALVVARATAAVVVSLLPLDSVVARATAVLLHQTVTAVDFLRVDRATEVVHRLALVAPRHGRLLLLDFNVRANVNPGSRGRQWDPERLDIGLHIEDPAQAALDAIAFEEEYLD